MTKADPWFFEERALAFAKLALTERSDVRPYDGSSMDLDLLVEIGKDTRSAPRRFGVQIVPYMDLPEAGQANERVLAPRANDPLTADLPLCVFVIGVRKPEGIYRWTLEPVIEGGRALLRPVVEGKWQPLNKAGVARLLDQVDAWYDARAGGDIAPQPRGRASKTAG